MSIDACDRCGFTPADYSERDVVTAPQWLAAMTAQTTEGVGGATENGPVRGSLDRLQETIRSLDREQPDVAAIHRALHELRALGRNLHDRGAGVPTQEGTVAQINTSDGGVPKRPVVTADVGRCGVLGDRQDNRVHHGRPFQALCLWSTEVIDALAAEGHPIHAGAAGENVTISGIDWPSLRPGVQLLVGEVACELSSWAQPCRKNDQWFTGRSDRIAHEQHPGWSRAYAWVLEPGTISVGDRVLVEP